MLLVVRRPLNTTCGCVSTGRFRARFAASLVPLAGLHVFHFFSFSLCSKEGGLQPVMLDGTPIPANLGVYFRVRLIVLHLYVSELLTD